VLNLPIRG